MQTYIKRLVSEHGIPEDGEYDTDLGRIEVFCEKWVSDEGPEYYYEESPQTSKLPNDGEKWVNLKELVDYINGNEDRDFNLINAPRLLNWVNDYAQVSRFTAHKLSLEEAKEMAEKVFPYIEGDSIYQKGNQDLRREGYIKALQPLPQSQLQSEQGEAVKFAEASFIAGYKYRAEADGKIFDFASELHAKSHFIKFKNQYPKEQKGGKG